MLANKIIAQHPVYTHLTEKDGLPDIEFYDIIEDNEGVIWLAADKGLFSYDGKKFKNFSHPQKRGLSVFGLKLDAKGRVWCNNISGQIFYLDNGKLLLFYDFQDKVNGQLAVFTFVDNNVVVSTETGVYEVDSKGLFEYKTLDENIRLLSSLPKKDSLLSFDEDKILVRAKNKKLKVKYDLKKYGEFNFNIWDVTTINNIDLIFAYNTKNLSATPKLYYGVDKKLKEVLLPKELVLNNGVIKFYSLDDKLWFCTKKGVFIYQFLDNKLHYEKTYFKGVPISRFVKDRNNNYWFTTLTDGVFIIPNLYIEKYSIEKDKENLMAISALGTDALMMGSIKGDLMILDKNTNEISHLIKKINNKLYAIVEGKNNMYLSFANGSLIYNKDSKQLTRDNFLYNAKDVTFLDENNLLYATHSTASAVNISSRKKTELRATRTKVVYYSSKKEKYIGYTDGTEMYNQKNEAIQLKFNEQPVFANNITETTNNVVWVSTLKDGIIGFKRGEVVKHFSEKNGLLSNQVGEIKGEKEFLWISTNKGLQLLNTNNNKIKSLTRKDGVASFNISGFMPDEKVLFFTSNKGLFKIDKEKAFKNNKILDFYFTSIEVDGEKIVKKETYSFESNVKKIKFNFHANGFLSHEDVVYKYVLKEYSNPDNWNVLDKGINQITINNLAPGNYIFKLKEVSLSGEQETKAKVIKITINKPFYKRQWFYVITTVFIIFLYWLIFYLRLKRVKKKQEEAIANERMQKELIASKLKALQSQMNPHFTFNALNSIQNLVLKGDKNNAYNFLTKFSSLLRESLALSNKSFVFFEEEISVLKKYLELEKLRFRDNFTYEIIGEELIENIKIPTMIIQPFIENAIKHGLFHKVDGVGKIKIEFFQENFIKCIITDNGVGLDESHKINKKIKEERESFSTKMIKDKLKILKKHYGTDIGFEYQAISMGTKLVIKIPFTF